MSALAGAALREALAGFPSGVTIVTTRDGEGQPWGFTASSFCSLSLDPPLVLVCLARTADSYPAFMRADGFVIHVLGPEHEALARRFAAKGEDKFAGDEFALDGDGCPILPTALATLRCTVHARPDGGDHVILVGRVVDATARDGAALVYFRRSFEPLPAPGAPARTDGGILGKP